MPLLFLAAANQFGACGGNEAVEREAFFCRVRFDLGKQGWVEVDDEAVESSRLGRIACSLLLSRELEELLRSCGSILALAFSPQIQLLDWTQGFALG